MNGSIMGGTAAVAGTAHVPEPILQRIANRIFRCSHRHKSHALTPKGETQRYAVCLDCGARLVPNVPALPADTSVQRGFRAAICLGLMALILAGISLFWVARRPATISPAGGRFALIAPAAVTGFSASPIAGTGSLSVPPASSSKPEDSAVARVETAPAPLPLRGIHSAARLESQGSIVVLGRDAASALELSLHPAALSALIQSGALFAVSRGTTIKICQSKGRISQVQVLEGVRRGQEGWVPTWQITTP